MSTNFGLSQIGQIAVTVTDVGFFDCGGVRLMLTLPEGSGATHSSFFPDAAWPSKGSRTWSPSSRATTCGWPSSATPTGTCWG